MKDIGIGAFVLGLGILTLCACVALPWYVYKNVQVWAAEMSGRAVLAEAEYSRRVRVEEAQARADSAELLGQAELTQAEYAARSNEQLAMGLGGPEAYLRYMYIRMLEETGLDSNTIIYIPTEGGMPILEAGQRPDVQ